MARFTNAQLEGMQVSECSVDMLLQVLDGRCPDCFLSVYRVKDSQEKRGNRDMYHIHGDTTLAVGLTELLKEEVRNRLSVEPVDDEDEES